MLVVLCGQLDTLLSCGWGWPACPPLQQAGWSSDFRENLPVALDDGRRWLSLGLGKTGISKCLFL